MSVVDKLLQVDTALSVLVIYPDTKEAVRYLEQHHDIKTTAAVLESVKVQNPERYEERRRELGPQLEGGLAHDFLDNARMAAHVERLAIRCTGEMLRTGKVKDPARVARDMSQVKTQNVDKRLALQGRPTQIIEKRSPEELRKRLIQLGVIDEVIEGDAQEDG